MDNILDSILKETNSPPYKNFAEFAIKVAPACKHCNGSGVIWNPKTPSCPIEGNKMRDTIPCPHCNGSKIEKLDKLPGDMYLYLEYHREMYKHHKEIHDKLERAVTVYRAVRVLRNAGMRDRELSLIGLITDDADEG